MARFRTMALVAVLAVAAAATTTFANEIITYKYDGKGRLVQVLRSGTVNDNVITNYTFDRVENRRNVKVTGSPNPPQP